MTRVQRLEKLVRELYDAKDLGRADWAGWLYEHHVFVVADYATELAGRYGADVELARAAAMLHDVADVTLNQRGEKHAAESLRLARKLMAEVGFSAEEVQLVVDDAIRYHSCHGSERPQSVEGKILATADSMAHLKTDFYVHAPYMLARKMTWDEVKAWTLEKIERDLNIKTFFEDVRSELRPDYELVKTLFSR